MSSPGGASAHLFSDFQPSPLSAMPERFRVIHNAFRRSTETISRYFQHVMYAVGELRGEMIKPPSNNTPPKIKNSYMRFPYFRDCIGAINGTHVTAKVAAAMSATFCGRKHYTSQNVLAGVDFDLRFTYSRPDGLQIPDGKFYLGDIGYACRPSIPPPFKKIRYHLNEFSPRNRPQNAKELFNLRHSNLRVTNERAFAAFKNRFKILVWGEDDFFQDVVTFDEVEIVHGVEAGNNEAWKEKRLKWANAMWEAIDHTTI
ncbi:uncharacterized protein [Lolium perenne]|uniref:uncharacterized protein n=1 Tax=Lolium perenne TaxID=4522 RepID=UPI003A99F2F7